MSEPAAPPESSIQPARRPLLKRPLFWAILVLLVWFGIGSVLGPLAGKLSEVQKNDNASFLPASAESTKVLDLQAKFSQQQTFPMFLLFTRDAGLTSSDVGAVNAYAQTIPSLPLTDDKGVKLEGDKTVGDYLAPGPIVPIPSKDGKAILIDVPLDSTKSAQVMPNGKSPVVGVAQTLLYSSSSVAPGLTRYLTGPGGILADLFKVFGSLDSSLLLITGAVVALILIIVYRSPVLWFIPLLSAIFALSTASGVIYLLAKNNVLTLNGQSQGILTVLVFGAATDYALLMVARYREDLHRSRAPSTPCGRPGAGCSSRCPPRRRRSRSACSACCSPSSTATSRRGRSRPSGSCARTSRR